MRQTFNRVRGSKYSSIQWENFNFPPCLKLIHYDLNEIEEPEKAYTKKLYFSLLLLFAWNLFNMLVNIIVVSSGKGDGKRIFYSIFMFILFQPLSLWVFYKGYRSLVDPISPRSHYFYGQGFLLFILFLGLILNAYAFNGLMMLFSLGGKAFAIIFVLLEVILVTL